MVIFIVQMAGPLIVYYQLLCQMAYPLLTVLLPAINSSVEGNVIDLDPDFTGFSYSYTCILIFVMLFLITMKKDVKIFIRINTLGVVFTILVVLFMAGIGIYGFSTTNYEHVYSFSGKNELNFVNS